MPLTASRPVLLDYRNHRPWIWCTLAAAALGAGVYHGTIPPSRPGSPYLLGGAGVLLAAVLFRLAWRVLFRATTVPRLALGVGWAGGFFLIGAGLGSRWAGPSGPTASGGVGLWFGLLGSACMIFAGLLPALRRVPSWWWVGSRQAWLKGHLWLGLLSGLFIAFHSGFRLGGPLEAALWVVLLLVIGSGVLGLVLQHVIPRLLTARVPGEVPYEQIPRTCLLLRRKADALVDALCGPTAAGDVATGKGDPRVDPAGRSALRQAHEAVIRTFLGPRYVRASPLARPAQAAAVFGSLRAAPGLSAVADEVGRLERFCADRREMGEQERWHHWLHLWLLGHVPLSALLLGLGVAHVVTALYY